MKFTIAAICLVSAAMAGDCSINEENNYRGPNQCWFNSECAGARTCGYGGYCQGESGCACQIDESKNVRGPNRCDSSTEC